MTDQNTDHFRIKLNWIGCNICDRKFYPEELQQLLALPLEELREQTPCPSCFRILKSHKEGKEQRELELAQIVETRQAYLKAIFRYCSTLKQEQLFSLRNLVRNLAVGDREAKIIIYERQPDHLFFKRKRLSSFRIQPVLSDEVIYRRDLLQGIRRYLEEDIEKQYGERADEVKAELEKARREIFEEGSAE